MIHACMMLCVNMFSVLVYYCCLNILELIYELIGTRKILFTEVDE